MKLRLVYPFALTILCAVVLLGNKNGRASEAKAGNTGAPGDEALPNGNPITCISCHTASPIASTMTVSVLDSAGNAVTQYIPGYQYTAKVTITATAGSPQGYGFQMIALKDNGNTDLDGFSDPGNQTVNNYKIATIPNGRTYAEHDNVSTPNVFNVKWKAPAAGTGNITFYAAGNAVNKNGQNSGDGATVTSLKLTESLGTSTQNPDAERIVMRLWPNPVASVAWLSFVLPAPGEYRLTAHDLSGRLVWQTTRYLSAGEQALEIPAADWSPGVYFTGISGAGISANGKLVKR
ncbi:MAG: T9SS type A sorting domain-containing protein [Lewinellaceae bacterium]|nr:T9SS type A sorting domain-containing protein [Lewinellaceae bacterium]